jgi:hypothetical protein
MRPAPSSSDAATANALIRQVIQRILEYELIVVRHDERPATSYKVKVLFPCVRILIACNFSILPNLLDFQKRQRSPGVCQESPDGHPAPIINLHDTSEIWKPH